MATTQERPAETTEEQQQQADGHPRQTEAQPQPQEDKREKRTLRRLKVRIKPTLKTIRKSRAKRKKRLHELPSAKADSRRSLPFVLVIVVVGALLWWLHARQYEDTDDAQVDGHIGQIGSRISGYITGVHVEDNQEVQAGAATGRRRS